ncbi:type II toxin-antitoxin system TacA family antitoxin [Paralysiella testudinis]|nr:DUF1778 domain-containing protein [Paralysiella testudinis]
MATLANARLEARVSKDIHAMLKRAAELEGRSLSDFVISAAQAAAQKTISETEVLQLSIRDQHLFAEALIQPPQHNEALQRAFLHHTQLLAE